MLLMTMRCFENQTAVNVIPMDPLMKTDTLRGNG